MNPREAARLIDISAVRTHHTEADVRECVRIAKEYGFINVHSLPAYTALVAELLADEPEIYVGAPVGFPGGGHRTETKIREAELLVQDGVQEMDIVMNVGRFKDGDHGYVLDELKQIVALAPENVLTKVIIEINALTDEEMLAACRLVMDSGADFVKTGTGWVPVGAALGSGGGAGEGANIGASVGVDAGAGKGVNTGGSEANIERIAKIKSITKDHIKVKAAGGIRTREEFDRLLDLGVERFGINTRSALEIVGAV
jgi:deoxyribose-phosphate aldolase